MCANVPLEYSADMFLLGLAPAVREVETRPNGLICSANPLLEVESESESIRLSYAEVRPFKQVVPNREFDIFSHSRLGDHLFKRVYLRVGNSD